MPVIGLNLYFFIVFIGQTSGRKCSGFFRSSEKTFWVIHVKMQSQKINTAMILSLATDHLRKKHLFKLLLRTTGAGDSVHLLCIYFYS